ncbi:MAG: hypothetical protein Q9160_006286 [Pyrenula sp. 1 TL-2023]
MTAEQRAQIKKKTRGKSPEDNWFHIYRILFPDADLPFSPYIEDERSRAVTGFVAYFRSEAPSLLSAALRRSLRSESSSLDIVDFQSILSQMLEDSAGRFLGSTARDLPPAPRVPSSTGFDSAQLEAPIHVPNSLRSNAFADVTLQSFPELVPESLAASDYSLLDSQEATGPEHILPDSTAPEKPLADDSPDDWNMPSEYSQDDAGAFDRDAFNAFDLEGLLTGDQYPRFPEGSFTRF